MENFVANYKLAQEIYASGSEEIYYFDSISAEKSKKSLMEGILSDENYLSILVSSAGVGKTYLIKHICTLLKEDLKVIYIAKPFYSDDELLRFLYRDMTDEPLPSLLDTTQVLEFTKAVYLNSNHVIIVDEAQLWGSELLERIRIISDLKIFNLVLLVHEDEKFLKYKSVTTRPICVVSMELLSFVEVHRYIEHSLLQYSHSEIVPMFTRRLTQKIYHYTKGNFRLLRQMMSTLMELLHFAQQEDLRKYKHLNNQLVVMAAIECGLEKSA